MNTRYFEWIRQETEICKVFQSYIEQKRWCKSYLWKRENPQASVDFLGRLYDKDTNTTVTELAVEVRTLNTRIEQIEYINFPIQKVNELMKFWRMKKEVYVVYKLLNEIIFLNWDYYMKHNFEVWNSKKWVFLKLPINSFIKIN